MVTLQFPSILVSLFLFLQKDLITRTDSELNCGREEEMKEKQGGVRCKVPLGWGHLKTSKTKHN